MTDTNPPPRSTTGTRDSCANIDSASSKTESIADCLELDPESVIPQAAVAEAIQAAKDNHTQDELLGECCYNAVRLAAELNDRGIDADVVRGVVASNGDPPETMSEAETQDGACIHWWVQFDHPEQDTTVVADLATEIDAIRGQTLLRVGQPEEYAPFQINPPHTDQFHTRPSR
jgi:hypothetical protein